MPFPAVFGISARMNAEPQTIESSPNARNSAARLAAVQALYQIKCNHEPVALVIEEYRQHRLGKTIDDVESIKPDSLLFERILKGVTEHAETVHEMLFAGLNKEGQQRAVPMEPLLNSILSCGAYELMSHQDIDAPILIDDYLNITHAFYDQGEHKLVNAVLDRVKAMTR